MPGFLRLCALVLALLMVGAPSLIAQAVDDDCASECASDEEERCPDRGCTDCSIVCSSCPRTHVVAPAGPLALAGWRTTSLGPAIDGPERVPSGPPPEGVFHPPRHAR